MTLERQRRFEDFSDYVYSRAMRFARSIVRDTEEAEDIVQDALIKAFRAYEKSDDSPLGTNWLYQIIRRVHIDRIRAKSRRIQAVSYDEITRNNPDFACIDPSVDVEKEALADAQDPMLDALLRSLPEDQQKLIRLSLCEEISDEESARYLNCSCSAYRRRLRTAKRSLVQAAKTMGVTYASA